MSFRTALKFFGAIIALVVIVFILIQLIPVNTANPPIVSEPDWDSSQTRALAQRACFDCHSNETVWPSYAKIAPVSWLVVGHVSEGREKLNFSDWQRSTRGEAEAADEAIEVITEGEMPPIYYTAIHPEARLSAIEKQQLVEGLQKTFSNTQP
ncbi:MAG TPA: cytochrome C [Anaerolineae bacterium]|nr:cytochrome C [Anaerolineae bacterium]